MGKKKWQPSDMDAFQLETESVDYYYAVEAALNGQGDHWYKEDKVEHEIKEVKPSEIVDIVQKHPEKIVSKCPCLTIREGKLIPVVYKEVIHYHMY